MRPCGRSANKAVVNATHATSAAIIVHSGMIRRIRFVETALRANVRMLVKPDRRVLLDRNFDEQT